MTTEMRRGLASAVVGVAGVALFAWVAREPPSALDAPARWVRAHVQDGDVVVAVGCAAPGDVDRFAPARTVCDDAPPLRSLSRFSRVLVARPSTALVTLLTARFGAPRGGGQGVRVFRPSPTTFDLRASLDRATVARGGEPCPRRGARHTCSGASWRTGERRTMTVGGLALECVFAHPSEDGLSIEVPLPPGTATVRGVAGLSDRAAARRRGPAVRLRVDDDMHPPTLLDLPNRSGLRPWSATTADARRLRIQLTTVSQGARSLCVQAWGVPQDK